MKEFLSFLLLQDAMYIRQVGVFKFLLSFPHLAMNLPEDVILLQALEEDFESMLLQTLSEHFGLRLSQEDNERLFVSEVQQVLLEMQIRWEYILLFHEEIVW